MERGSVVALTWQATCFEQRWGISLKRALETATDDLEINIDSSEEGIVMRLHGHVGIDSSPKLRDQLSAALRDQSARAVIVDFTNVPYIDSSGLATLIEALKIARHRQRMFCLRGLQSSLLHLFQITGLLTLFEANGCGSASSAPKVS